MQKPPLTESALPCSVDSFLKSILRSGVLDRQELSQALRSVPSEQRQDAEALADHLVEAGKLSRFQASKLLRGMAVGLVLGPFHVLAPIGKGGMGTVYLARDSRSQALVALKVLPPSVPDTEVETDGDPPPPPHAAAAMAASNERTSSFDTASTPSVVRREA